MTWILTHYGLRWLGIRLYQQTSGQLMADERIGLMLKTLRDIILEGKGTALHDELVQAGLLKVWSGGDKNAVKFRIRTNPLEHVTRLVFEFTTRCNFQCAHCRNGYMEASTETDVSLLKRVADVMLDIGVRRFDFIGGEVTRYGNGWLDLARHINGDRKDPDRGVTVYGNGWWLGENNFEAAGRQYVDDGAYLDDLVANGVTHILFSIDGQNEHHDRFRGHAGLYDRIFSAIGRIREKGLQPRISALISSPIPVTILTALAGLANQIYTLPTILSDSERLTILQRDPFNHFSHFIDIGRGGNQRRGIYRLEEFPPEQLRCKAFYRPAPSLRIKANGEVSVCPLLTAGEGYGNVHHGELVLILNRMEESLGYRIHAGNRIGEYLPMLDRSLFGDRFDHLCFIKAVLTLLARELEKESDRSISTLRRVNERVARSAIGFGME